MTLTFNTHIFIQSICLRSLAAIVSENPLFSLFPIEKPKLPNLTLLFYTQRSSFEQITMGRSPRYYIPSFMELGLPVPEEKIFEGFLPYMGLAAILVM